MARSARSCWRAALALGLATCLAPAVAHADAARRQVLAFYYGWYGNPTTSGAWRHWLGVDPASEQIADATHFPALGAYDSHDPATVDRQAAQARQAPLTGFIASWWGRRSFEDRGLPLLLSTAGRYGLGVTAYYERVEGGDPASRKAAAVADLDYLIGHYGADGAWLRVGGKPVVFVYGRALGALTPADWQQVLAQVRHDNPTGALFVADSQKPEFVSVFDGASTYNITGQTQHKTPLQIAAWAHAAYPAMVAAAGPGKISTVTVIPGYDDRKVRPAPRPVTDRWGGETYRAQWREAIAAAPDWVLITSWNEWHEGSEIEPSVEYGSRALDDTATFSREFLGRVTTAPRR